MVLAWPQRSYIETFISLSSSASLKYDVPFGAESALLPRWPSVQLPARLAAGTRKSKFTFLNIRLVATADLDRARKADIMVS